MTRLIYGACLAVLLAGAATAAPPEVTPEIKAKPGQLVRVVVKGANTGYLRNFTDDEAFFGEMVSPVKGERHFVFQPPQDKPKGSYVLGFFTKGEDTGAAVTIVVETPVPPAPTPTPDPTPDDDRTAFAAAIKAAYKADASVSKAKDTLALASVYRAASRTTVRDTTVTTNAMLFADMTTASRALLPAAAIPGIRSVIGERLTGTTSKPGLLRFPADPINRDAAAAEFAAIATALEGATK